MKVKIYRISAIIFFAIGVFHFLSNISHYCGFQKLLTSPLNEILPFTNHVFSNIIFNLFLWLSLLLLWRADRNEKQAQKSKWFKITKIYGIITLSVLIIGIPLMFIESHTEKVTEYLYPDVDLSRDDTRIVFSYFKDGLSAIYIANSDGTDTRQLTYPQNEVHLAPKFSPDSTQIVFLSFPSDSKKPSSSIDILRLADGIIEKFPITDGNSTEAVFSPDGSKIYFLLSTYYGRYSPIVKKSNHDFDIYSIDINTKKVERLTYNKEYYMCNLSIFPDGKTLLYSKLADNDKKQLVSFIRFLSLKDSKEINYFIPKTYEENLDSCILSPDGESMIVTKKIRDLHKPPSVELFLMDLKTKQLKRLTRVDSAVTGPIFFHSKEKVLFLQNINYGTPHRKKYQLMQINLDGTKLEKIDLRILEPPGSFLKK